MTGRPAARMFDMCTGHKGAKPRPNDQGSPNVMINGRPAHRVGDHWMMHSGHFSFLAQGSPTVMTNGRPQGRVGDMIICTSRVMTGSPNVMVGDAAIVAPAYTGPLPSVGLDASLPPASNASSSGGSWARIKKSSGNGFKIYDDEGNIIGEDDGLAEPIEPIEINGKHLAWGLKVSADFRNKVFAIADKLGMPDQDGANWLMAIMAFESGRSFSPSKRNIAGSGATGLIQFMPDTAKGMGTSTASLSRMTPETQLDWVYKYFRPYAGKLNSLESAYMAVLRPANINSAMGAVLFRRGSTAYSQNSGLDKNRDGTITKYEAAEKVRLTLNEGLGTKYRWNG